MSRKPLILGFLVMLGGLWLAGCGAHTDTPQTTGTESKVSDSDTRVVLGTSVDRDSMGIADRIRVRVSLDWENPALVELQEPDWTGGDWTLIESTSTPVETRGGRLHQEFTYLLEPFLPGDYEIPAFSVKITPEKDASDQTTISTEPLAITVQGVLADDDAGTLNPASETRTPAPDLGEQRTSKALVYAGIAAVLVVSVVVVLVLTRGDKERAAGPSIHDRLVKITRQGDTEPGEAYSQLCEVYSLLDPRLRQTSEIRRLISVCERARYARSAGDAPSPSVLARHTLELLGSTGEDAA